MALLCDFNPQNVCESCFREEMCSKKKETKNQLVVVKNKAFEWGKDEHPDVSNPRSRNTGTIILPWPHHLCLVQEDTLTRPVLNEPLSWSLRSAAATTRRKEDDRNKQQLCCFWKRRKKWAIVEFLHVSDHKERGGSRGTKKHVTALVLG